MGQKINPILFRLSSNKHWRSSMYVFKPYSYSLLMDLKIRTYFMNLFSSLRILLKTDNILIKRYPNLQTIHITIKILDEIPDNLNMDEIKTHLSKITGYQTILINIKRYDHFNYIYSAQWLSKYVSQLVEGRSLKEMKRLLSILKNTSNLKGYKIRIGGRINGVEMARHRTYKRGSLPLQSIQSPIDYAYHAVYTRYGIIGVKVWLLYQY